MAGVKQNPDRILDERILQNVAECFNRRFSLGIELVGLDGRVVEWKDSQCCRREFCRLVGQSRIAARRCRQDRTRSLNFAFETGQPYFSFCHAGIVQVCIPIMQGEKTLGGLFIGRCLNEELNDAVRQDIMDKVSDLPIDRKKLRNSLGKLPVITARQIYDASEFLFKLLYENTQLDSRAIQFRRQKTLQQAKIGEYIQERKKQFSPEKYPYHRERELIEKVKLGDKTGAREILNEILGSIMLSSPGQLNVLKARLAELLGVLSRSAAEGGVEIDLLLEKNLDYISKVINLNVQEDICVWISKALNDFIDSVHIMQNSRKMGHIKRAIDFIEKNFQGQISLKDISRASCLSASRLAHLFKDEMRMTVFDYLTRVRIYHAKELLLATNESCTEICFDVGYNYQSYFTRAFKKTVGLTPKQFRKQNNQEG